MSFNKVGYTIFWIPVRIPPFKNEKVKNARQHNCTIDDPGIFNNSFNRTKTLSLLIKIESDARVIISAQRKGFRQKNDELNIYQLDYIDFDKYGFTQYKISVNTDLGFEHDDMWPSLSLYIYRLFKKLFHNHRYHLENEYFINTPLKYNPTKIYTKDRAAFRKHFTNDIHNKIKILRNYLSDNIQDKYSLRYRYNIWINPRKQYALATLTRDLDNTVEILKYLDHLRGVANFHASLDNYFDDINNIREELSLILNARRSVQSVWLGRIGFGIAILSICLAFFFKCSSDKQQEGFEKLINKSRSKDSLAFVQLQQKLINAHMYSEYDFDSLCLIINKELCSIKDSIVFQIDIDTIKIDTQNQHLLILRKTQ